MFNNPFLIVQRVKRWKCQCLSLTICFWWMGSWRNIPHVSINVIFSLNWSQITNCRYRSNLSTVLTTGNIIMRLEFLCWHQTNMDNILLLTPLYSLILHALIQSDTYSHTKRYILSYRVIHVLSYREIHTLIQNRVIHDPILSHTCSYTEWYILSYRVIHTLICDTKSHSVICILWFHHRHTINYHISSSYYIWYQVTLANTKYN